MKSFLCRLLSVPLKRFLQQAFEFLRRDAQIMNNSVKGLRFNVTPGMHWDYNSSLIGLSIKNGMRALLPVELKAELFDNSTSAALTCGRKGLMPPHESA